MPLFSVKYSCAQQLYDRNVCVSLSRWCDPCKAQELSIIVRWWPHRKLSALASRRVLTILVVSVAVF